MDGHCGLIAAWQVLLHYGRRVAPARIASACGYTKRHGVFTIGLAAGLKALGLEAALLSTRLQAQRRDRTDYSQGAAEQPDEADEAPALQVGAPSQY